ncbi:chromosome partitioning protein [Halovenus aranensis]|uniref:Chromosome partitioning protein n=1 Tax=Halovenus aranensis TaxID=890420 RepID=A0A1G8TJL2_9EURY|nr:ParA family protein [Halovenus aranensis]SDJ41698.1 chromosome partitioning protein [Halovenus aranensis]
MTGDDTGPARFCVTNAKGGTGKTTIAINVAGALNQRGRDVLFVDVDPQGNATEGLGLLEAYDASPPTLFDVLTDVDTRPNVGDLVVEHEEMDVLPANIDLLHAEHELTLADVMAQLQGNRAALDALEELTLNVEADDIEGPHALNVLSAALSHIEDDYDYVIVDSPPFYGKLTDASIFATGNVLVPALTEATSERAIELLMQQIAALEDHVDMTVNTVGVVANRVEQTNEDETMIEWLNEVYPETPVWEVRKRVALQRAFSAGNSVFEYDPSVDMADVFETIAAELDRQFDRPEVKP